MLGWPVLRENGWYQGTDEPDKLLDEALEELRTRGSSGSAGVELAVRSGYYLAIHRALIRETTRSYDVRSPYQVLQRMTESEHGLRALHAAIIACGCASRPPRSMPKAPRSVPRTGGPWRRTTPGSGARSRPLARNPSLPSSVVTPRRPSRCSRAGANVSSSWPSQLDSEVREAAAVQGKALPLVRERGWPVQQANRLADQLTGIASRLRLWAAIAELNEQAENHPGDLDDADDEPGDL